MMFAVDEHNPSDATRVRMNRHRYKDTICSIGPCIKRNRNNDTRTCALF